METEEKLIPYTTADLTGKRTIVFAPHPDDETLGCGGSLILHSEAGDPLRVIFLTDGAKGDASGKMEADVYVSLRRQEAELACKCLGINDLVFWTYRDRSLAGSRGALRDVMDQLADFQPELVYSPSLQELHPDHRAAALLVYDAIRCCDLDMEVAFYEVGQPLGNVNTLVDITPVLDRKLKAIESYESQLRERPYQEIVLALNRFRSLTLPVSISHAEAFSLWPADAIRKLGLTSIAFPQVGRFGPDRGEAGPLVSVIVRTKNRPTLLDNAIRSIVQQTYANLEIVVVNDGGQDINDLVETIAGDIPVTYVSHKKNMGRSAAANAGMKAAKGLYLNFLDDDDVFYPEHIETLVSYLMSNDAEVAYSSVLNVYYDGPVHMPKSRSKEEIMFNFDFDSDRLLFENYIPLMSVLFARDVVSRVNGFCEELTLFEDWDFWIQVSRHFTFHHVDKVTAEYRFYGGTDIETSHRQKYRYDESLAIMFDRVLPYLDGKAWVRYLQEGMVGTLRHEMWEREAKLLGIEKKTSHFQEEARRSEEVFTRLKEQINTLSNENRALKNANAECETALARIRNRFAYKAYRKIKSLLIKNVA